MIKGNTIKVHNHGFIRVVDTMGDDAAIVQMARVSYGEGTKTVNEDRGLIRYLMRHRHTSPFEGCEIKLHLKMPIFVARQWIRHRTASLNEVSARYSELPSEYYLPVEDDIQAQAVNNKQGRQEDGLRGDAKWRFFDRILRSCRKAFDDYRRSLDDGVARELARIQLPLATYTEFYWKIDLHNLLHFLSLRADPHAQKEIRDYAEPILHEIVRTWVPHTYEAFLDYVQGAKTFSSEEVKTLKRLLALIPSNLRPFAMTVIDEMPGSKREKEDFLTYFNSSNPGGLNG
jgi:thymidylate synthase (FAD)